MKNNELLELYIEDLKSSIYIDGKIRPKFYRWSLFNQLGVFFENVNTPSKIDINKTWVWSDQHFYHKNIIKYSARPFDDLEHMHFEMLKRHNKMVNEDDVVIWVGDVGFAPDSILNEMLSKYNGYKILVMGNHDLNHKKVKHLEFDELYITYQLNTDDVDLVFTHFPMMNLPKPCINVHGHEHQHPNYVGRPQLKSKQHINMCCEYWDYAPVRLSDIIDIAKVRILSL